MVVCLMLTNADLTLYNKYIDPTTRAEKYQRSEIKGVNWQGAKAVYLSGVGLVKSDIATIRIPLARGANYVMPIAWQALTTKTGKWTLQAGDVVVRGIVTDAISDSFTITALRAKYDNALMITAVDSLDQGSANMQHWQIGVK